jgi:toxin ParE1/3/4
MKLIISDQAVADLADVWSYIAGDDVDAADRFVDTLYGQCEQLCHSPGMGRTRDEVLPGLRSFPVGRYIIFYRSRGNGVEIARILSAYRDIGSLF